MTTNRYIVLITGANAGLGFETVRGFCSSSKTEYEILLGGRSLKKAEQAAEAARAEFPGSHIVPVQLDIEDDASIQALSAKVESTYGRLDILVNNAGGQFDPQYAKGEMTLREAWAKSWSVNVTSTHAVTEALVPRLIKSSNPRLLFITSGTSALTTTENPKIPANSFPAAGWPKTDQAAFQMIPAYRSSKTGLNMVMRDWHRTLRADGVKTWAISPGFLATGLGGHGSEGLKKSGAGDPGPAGEFVREVAEGSRDDDVGLVILRDGIQPW